uniref:Uncharacterized protein n=1 Tax=Rhizophagus irregularis (strain DAOM 181602 / DAOM 197198 / MUCL 43194) TaxID=747089 RepID=U9TTE6_RHIID
MKRRKIFNTHENLIMINSSQIYIIRENFPTFPNLYIRASLHIVLNSVSLMITLNYRFQNDIIDRTLFEGEIAHKLSETESGDKNYSGFVFNILLDIHNIFYNFLYVLTYQRTKQGLIIGDK